MQIRAAISLLGLAAASCSTAGHDAFGPARAAMVERIRETAGRDYPGLVTTSHFAHALAAIAQVPREHFVPKGVRGQAYQDRPLPIGYDQTISDPYIVAVMTAALALPLRANILEIGTGSGYQAAVLSRLAARVHSVEIVAPLAQDAAALLARLGATNVTVRAGDGFLGWPEAGPYDAIIVTAGAARVPPPLISQLKSGGTLVMPIGPQGPLEQLLVIRKADAGGLDTCSMGPVMFVPLRGRGERPQSMKGLYDRSVPACF